MSGAEGEADGSKRTVEEAVAEIGGAAEAERNPKLKDRKVSWAKLRRIDSLNLEAGRVSMVAHNPYKVYIHYSHISHLSSYLMNPCTHLLLCLNR